MNFLNPDALWLLLAVPVLILVYILKTQHEERRLSSTYIWKRSEKLIKKKLPWQILRRSILFILQFLTVVIIALIAARPTMTVRGMGDEWIIIIDGSASMNIASGGSTRFERAVSEATKLAEDMRYGNKATVIYSGDNTSYMITRSDSSQQVANTLEALVCSDCTGDFENALALARLIQEQNEYAKILYYTDKDYEDVSDVTVINVAKENEWNVAAVSLSSINEDGVQVFMSSVVSYGADASVTAALYVDGKVVDAKQIECSANEPANTYWTNTGIGSFSTAEIYLEAEDGYQKDNSFMLCINRESRKKVMLISQNETLKTMLSAFDEFVITQYDTMENAYISQSTEESEALYLSGFDLYVFDGSCPDMLPFDGVSWFFNVKDLNADMGITRITEGAAILTENTEGVRESDVGKCIGGYLSFGESDESEAFSTLTSFYSAENIAVRVLYPYEAGSDYYAVMKCGDLPVLLVPKNPDEQYAIFAFDISDTNMPVLVDFAELFMDLEEYFYPIMLDTAEFSIGDAVTVSRLPKAEFIRLTRPDNSKGLLLPLESPRPFTADEPGIYTVTQEVKQGRRTVDVTYNFFVHTPKGESDTSLDGGSLVTANDSGAPDVGEGAGAIEIWIYLAMLLLAIIFIEWWVYYREQY